MADDSTIENRVYLFKDLASAFVGAVGDRLMSKNADVRARAQAALAELARISCIVADTEDDDAQKVADRIGTG